MSCASGQPNRDGSAVIVQSTRSSCRWGGGLCMIIGDVSPGHGVWALPVVDDLRYEAMASQVDGNDTPVSLRLSNSGQQLSEPLRPST
ncbi:hypothetical protein N7539_001929 [Penicillium diatomitis]|uniref:Uncharacterized protein n=1 Tax=Penicillium diatomitis TaxID=2819901 RepID=A0A9W9XHX7_9EURO|nr:uncharacterized protein N7539_001929 [Penicillium diatomitis]KAJ5493183.1 hypothetical protein N7539_001929 [Penicillium diatomitis]